MSNTIEVYQQRWLQAKKDQTDTEVQALIQDLLVDMERMTEENKRLKTALLKATTAQKPSMSTRLSEALRE
jgi:succinate dehydrogenase/fumarate reductase-like Fe-S protein